MFVVFIILAVLALVALIGGTVAKRSEDTEVSGAGSVVRRIGIGLAVVGAAVFAFTSFYSQGAGESRVVINWGGDIAGVETETGIHLKAPWQRTVSYDVRNNIVEFSGEAGAEGFSNGDASGPQITVQDREGVTANVDVIVTYSLTGSSVADIYAEYGSQENLVSRLVSPAIRSVVRNIPAQYNTLEFLNSRQEAGVLMFDALQDRFEGTGVVIESVDLQEIRYSEAVNARLDAAQESRIGIEQAEAELEASEIAAQQTVVEAQAEADANVILAESLSPEVLQARYIEALQNGADLYVVPEGSNTILTLPESSGSGTE